MDVSSVHNSKNQKLNEGHDMYGSSNSLDNLPDTILEHIVSFLPTKDAVGTSILSKRWQYLWMSIPNLDFSQGLPEKRRLFMNFVERVLLLRDFSNVEKFSLTCDVLNDASCIEAWISAAVRCKVQKIHICLSNFEEPFALPHCLFACDSLMRLIVLMPCILKLPPSICLSSLKVLILKDVTFLDDYSTQQLFSGCPVLEELDIDSCIWENLQAVCISAPKLKKLSIYEYDYDKDGDGDTFDLSDINGYQVMIFGASLKSFSYTGVFINDYCLYNSSSLVEASIDVNWSCQRPREAAYHINKLLRVLSNVNELTLSDSAVEFLDYAEELISKLPLFNNLTYLELGSGGVGGVDFYSKALPKILENSPHLTSLCVEGIDLHKSDGKDDWILDPVPQCFLSHLKSIEIYDCWPSEQLLHVMKFLLEKARVLERMYIRSWDRPAHIERRKEFNEQLLMLPRASMSCSIDLYEDILDI